MFAAVIEEDGVSEQASDHLKGQGSVSACRIRIFVSQASAWNAMVLEKQAPKSMNF